MISQSTIERIKILPIHSVVSHYVELKKAGANWRGLSPWNNEKTPSFWVVPSKNIYKDFSSGNGGGGIDFVMKRFPHLSYPEAIKEIADKCGERVEYDESATTPEERKRETEHTEILYRINQASAKQFSERLLKLVPFVKSTTLEDGERVDNYSIDPKAQLNSVLSEIVKRGFTADTLLQWQIGYAPGEVAGGHNPSAWRFLTELIGDKSYAPGLELGLIKTKNGHTYDTFRDRIMYPIHNVEGRIVGFGGRTLHEDKFNAKYINSKDSKIYKKEGILFGLYFAIEAIRKHGYAYLSEGYTDVISFHQAGFNCMVGLCNKIITEEQCKVLRRHCSKVILFPDRGDKMEGKEIGEGEQGAMATIDRLVQFGFETAVVPMPDIKGQKMDPDELTRMFANVELPVVAKSKSKKSKK